MLLVVCLASSALTCCCCFLSWALNTSMRVWIEQRWINQSRAAKWNLRWHKNWSSSKHIACIGNKNCTHGAKNSRQHFHAHFNVPQQIKWLMWISFMNHGSMLIRWRLSFRTFSWLTCKIYCSFICFGGCFFYISAALLTKRSLFCSFFFFFSRIFWPSWAFAVCFRLFYFGSHSQQVEGFPF